MEAGERQPRPAADTSLRRSDTPTGSSLLRDRMLRCLLLACFFIRLAETGDGAGSGSASATTMALTFLVLLTAVSSLALGLQLRAEVEEAMWAVGAARLVVGGGGAAVCAEAVDADVGAGDGCFTMKQEEGQGGVSWDEISAAAAGACLHSGGLCCYAYARRAALHSRPAAFQLPRPAQCMGSDLGNACMHACRYGCRQVPRFLSLRWTTVYIYM